MPENTVEHRPTDIGQILIKELIQTMAVLGKNVEMLSQKIEDSIAAQDDFRSVIEELSEITSETAGYLGSTLQIIDEVSEVGKDTSVTWTDINKVISKIKEANEQEGDDEESDN